MSYAEPERGAGGRATRAHTGRQRVRPLERHVVPRLILGPVADDEHAQRHGSFPIPSTRSPTLVLSAPCAADAAFLQIGAESARREFQRVEARPPPRRSLVDDRSYRRCAIDAVRPAASSVSPVLLAIATRQRGQAAGCAARPGWGQVTVDSPQIHIVPALRGDAAGRFGATASPANSPRPAHREHPWSRAALPPRLRATVARRYARHRGGARWDPWQRASMSATSICRDAVEFCPAFDAAGPSRSRPDHHRTSEIMS
jgi:hypothetical protein